MDQVWDTRFLNLAFEIANFSKDPKCKVGALLVSPNKRNIVIGYNGFPRGIADDSRLLDKKLKRMITTHAEMNAIYNSTENLEHWTLYVTKPPCVTCATAIIQKGISKVVTVEESKESSWLYQQQLAYDLFMEANIKVITI